jgi:hypothetical protein
MAEHYAFLRRRAEAGELVAAGPLLDVTGAGMTVLDVATAERPSGSRRSTTRPSPPACSASSCIRGGL